MCYWCWSLITKNIPDNYIVDPSKILRNIQFKKLELNKNDNRSEKEKMLNEEWYCSSDIELKNQRRKWNVCHKFNYSTNLDERLKILRNIFKKIEKEFFITPYFNCDYEYNISIGENFY